ncbi:TerC family protein [Sulfuricaulis sp.]|jgi:YjbE family integral membrane protein|uniref:TerC family protein n=1 Tax=Sulfuricaulis sp. TaxID=2003553 RepID=UPI003559C043
MIAWLSDAHTWIALLEIIGVNIVLSGDNAVVIALACRTLPPKQQRLAILFGAAGAIVLRVLLTGFAVMLLAKPYLKLAGGVLLLWIAVKLLLPDDDGDDDSKDNSSMYAAIKTIVIADLVMSLDNVLGVAAVAKGDVVLLILGLLISMPLIIYGSTLIMRLMGRFPVVITLGAALLGYVAGEMAVTDPVVTPWIEANALWLHMFAPLLGAVLVVLAGKYFARRKKRAVVEVAVEQQDSKP